MPLYVKTVKWARPEGSRLGAHLAYICYGAIGGQITVSVMHGQCEFVMLPDCAGTKLILLGNRGKYV